MLPGSAGDRITGPASNALRACHGITGPLWRERRAGRCEAPRRRRCQCASSRSGNEADARPPPRPFGLRPADPLAALFTSGRRAACAAHLPQNRTCAVRIRLFGMAGYYPRHRPGYDLVVPSGSASCAGALRAAQISRNRSRSDTSPRSAKYAFRSPRSTAGLWLSAQMD